MAEIGLQSLLAWTLASQFFVLGLLNIAAPEKFLNTYFHWNYPRCDRRVSGIMEICTALLIAIEGTFFWGMLLCSSKYIYALTGVGFLVFLCAGLFLLQSGVV
jgi:hypothetical protein